MAALRARAGAPLAGARVAKGWSQAELAAAASISVGACQRLESGESKHREPANPQLSTLAGVCGALGLRIGDLLPDWCPDVTGTPPRPTEITRRRLPAV